MGEKNLEEVLGEKKTFVARQHNKPHNRSRSLAVNRDGEANGSAKVSAALTTAHGSDVVLECASGKTWTYLTGVVDELRIEKKRRAEEQAEWEIYLGVISHYVNTGLVPAESTTMFRPSKGAAGATHSEQASKLLPSLLVMTQVVQELTKFQLLLDWVMHWMMVSSQTRCRGRWSLSGGRLEIHSSRRQQDSDTSDLMTPHSFAQDFALKDCS